MNAQFAPIPYPDVIAPPMHIPAPRPQCLDAARAQPCFEGADDMGEYSQTMPRASAPIVLTNSLKAPKVSAPDDEGYQHAMLPLGPTSVEVHFRVFCGEVSLDAVIVGDGWCDIEHFAAKTQHAWALALEEALS